VVHSDKELFEKLGRKDPVSVRIWAPDFKNCCMQAGQYDGSLRNYYQR